MEKARETDKQEKWQAQTNAVSGEANEKRERQKKQQQNKKKTTSTGGM